jgi:N utilization substance protein B
MSTRRSAREWALRVLFESDVGGAPVEEVLAGALERARLDEGGLALMSDLCRATAARQKEFDALLAANAVGHTLDRLARTDRTVLRMALAEIRAIGTPAPVVINEAVDLAKKYGTEESGRFVNGILGKIVRDWEQDGKGAGKDSGGSDS